MNGSFKYQEELGRLSLADLPWFVSSPCPSAYLADDFIVCDFETTNIDRGSALAPENRILLATYTRGSTGEVIGKWGNEYDQRELLEAISTAKFIVAHNAKFELLWFKRMGVDISKILVYDTMLAEYVIAGNRSWDLDLDSVCARYGVAQKGSIVKSLMKSGVCPSDIPEPLLYTYGVGDTANTREMFLKQREYIFANNLAGVVYTRCLTCTCLADIETYGMFLDDERVTKEFNAVSEKLGELDGALYRFTGGINPNSPKQLTEFVYDKLGFREITDRNGEPSRTAKGGRKADADTLAQLSANTEDQKQFKQLILARQEENTKLKSVKKMKECVDKDGGLLYAKFNQTITQTHRLSSSGAKHKLQFQNFHRPYKCLFKARKEGWLVGESDGAQLEFRVAADLGNDEQARADIREKVDVHRNTASVLWKIPSGKVTKTQRQAAKAETFKPLYGGRSGTEQQRKYYAWFRDRYSSVSKTQEDWVYQVLMSKVLVNPTGLRFYWPSTQMTRSGYVENTTSISNYPIQSFATAEIIPIALIHFWHYIKMLGLKMFVCNTVHDSIICELPEDEQNMFKAISYKSFTFDVYRYLKLVYNYEFRTPLGTESKIGTHWGLGDAEAWDVEPELI